MLGNEGILGEWVVKSIFIRLHLFLILNVFLSLVESPWTQTLAYAREWWGAELGASHCWRWWVPAGLEGRERSKEVETARGDDGHLLT